MNNFKLPAICIFMLLVIIGCSDDNISQVPDEVQPDIIVNDVSASILGSLQDENGLPITEAIVRCQSCRPVQEVTVDRKGDFRFLDITNEGESAYLTITAEGKFDGFRRLGLVTDRVNFTRIQLQDKTITSQLNTDTEARVTLSNEAAVTLPENGIVDSQGQSYQGNYNVSFQWIDPTSENLNLNMIGDLSAITNDGESTGLSTYGMLQVELESLDGEPLNLGVDAMATLEFPIPESLKANAPAEIQLWSYDEANGYWIEEGVATNQDDKYITQVSHFSTWNVDVSVESVIICGKLGINTSVDIDAPFLEVALTGESFQSIGGWLSDNGSFRFFNAPADELLTLEIFDFAGELIESIELGPYAPGKIEIGTILLDPADVVDIIEISGSLVDCDGVIIEDGYIAVEYGFDTYLFPLAGNGDFLISLPSVENFQAIVYGIDVDGIRTSAPSFVSTQTLINDLGTIMACSEEAEAYFLLNYHFDTGDPQDQGALISFDQDELYYAIQHNQYRIKFGSIFSEHFTAVTPTAILGESYRVAFGSSISPEFPFEAVGITIEYTELGEERGVGGFDYIQGFIRANSQEHVIEGSFRLNSI